MMTRWFDAFRDGLAGGTGWSLAILTICWFCRWAFPVDWIVAVLAAVRVAACG